MGVRYFKGTYSPNDAERRDKGYSGAWLHHKGRNRHHYEYWLDYTPDGDHHVDGVRMPEKYVAEMICDRIAASRTYNKEAYTDSCPWEYYERGKNRAILHPETRALLEKILLMLKEEGEEKTLRFVREEVLKK